MKATVPVIFSILICSCSATLPEKKAPEKAPDQLAIEFQKAAKAAESGDRRGAFNRLSQIVKNHPESDLADDAHLLIGQLYFGNQQYAEALSHFHAILHGPVDSPLEPKAGLQAAQALLKLGRHKEVPETLELARRLERFSLEQDLEAWRLENEAHQAMGNYIAAIQSLAQIAENHPDPSEKQKHRELSVELLETRLSERELAEIGQRSPHDFLRAPAKLKLALLLIENRQYATARRFLADVVNIAPDSPYSSRAQQLIQQIETRNRVNPKTVGVVLPLSGKQSSIGYKVLRGIQIGLGIFSSPPSGIRLAVVDSEGNPDTARRAVERLVTEDHVIGVIGGVLSRTAVAEAAKAQEFGVPTIMLSQKSGLTEAGESIFRNALTSEIQVQYLVEIAMNQLGYKNFAILFPNDAYGVEFTNSFWDEVKARGGNIVGAQPYDPKETDFRGHVQRLVGTYYLEDRLSEYRLRLRELKEKNPKKSLRQGGSALEDIQPPIVDFDAIFIPDSARAVGQIAPMLAYNDVVDVRLLGTNIWNSPQLISRGQKFVENALFIDGLLNTDPAFTQSSFVADFRRTFKEEPGFIETQAYDSALVFRQLIASGETTRLGIQQKISTLKNFPGAIGTLSVTPDREFRRPYAALTIKNGKAVPLESVRQ